MVKLKTHTKYKTTKRFRAAVQNYSRQYNIKQFEFKINIISQLICLLINVNLMNSKFSSYEFMIKR